VSDITAKPGDPLDALLAPPLGTADEQFRRRILERSLGVMRRRRGFRLAAAAGGLVASFVVGLSWWFGTHPAAEPTPSLAEGPRPITTPLSLEWPDDPAPTALAEEWQAFDAADRRAENYRRAGDRYLAAEDDPASALRCYGASLDADPAASLAADPDDSWLLLLVKDARIKEKSHAKRGG
jgi:hypothetical protein